MGVYYNIDCLTDSLALSGSLLWVFGGIGPSPNGYLNWHGDVTQDMFNDASGNNQLLSYYPSQREWTNSQCFGTIPTPRFSAASAIMREKGFLFGGCNNNQVWVNDSFQLDMQSLTWTQLRIGHISPQARSACTLTAISDNQLFSSLGTNVLGEVLSYPRRRRRRRCRCRCRRRQFQVKVFVY